MSSRILCINLGLENSKTQPRRSREVKEVPVTDAGSWGTRHQSAGSRTGSVTIVGKKGTWPKYAGAPNPLPNPGGSRNGLSPSDRWETTLRRTPTTRLNQLGGRMPPVKVCVRMNECDIPIPLILGPLCPLCQKPPTVVCGLGGD